MNVLCSLKRPLYPLMLAAGLLLIGVITLVGRTKPVMTRTTSDLSIVETSASESPISALSQCAVGFVYGLCL